VAAQVIAALGIEPSRPKTSISLGDPALLGFALATASEYFNVAPPISKRDKKSGATKRRQIDIEQARLAERLQTYG
jgi:DNA (cytosine-5)-methyltransferase 1